MEESAVTLPLSADTLAAAYEYLKSTPPFFRWNLPEAEDVRFRVSRRSTEFGRYQKVDGRHTIAMSARSIGQTTTLFKYLAHEMLHLHLEATGMEAKGGGMNTHNAAFRKFASEVCRVHGFDPKAFY